MKSRVGIITVAQEGRFRLMTRDGRSHVYLLAPDCAVEAQDLPALARRQAQVRVTYEQTDTLTAGVAHALEPTDNLERTR
jgi:hypothetical protein